MDRPLSPSRSSFDRDDGPPSYFNASVHDDIPIPKPAGSSTTMRLLPNGIDSDHKPYVQPYVQDSASVLVEQHGFPSSPKRKHVANPKFKHVNWNTLLHMNPLRVPMRTAARWVLTFGVLQH